MSRVGRATQRLAPVDATATRQLLAEVRAVRRAIADGSLPSTTLALRRLFRTAEQVEQGEPKEASADTTARGAV